MDPHRRPRPEAPEDDPAPQPDAIEGEISENPGGPGADAPQERPPRRRRPPNRPGEPGPADEVRNG